MSIAMVGGLLVSSIVTGRIISDDRALEALPGRRHGLRDRRPEPARARSTRDQPRWSGRRLHGRARPRPRRHHAEPRARGAEQHRPVRHGRGQLGRRVLPLDGRLDRRLGARRRAQPPGRRQGHRRAWPRWASRPATARSSHSIPDLATLPAPVRAVFEHAFGEATGHIFLVAVPFAVLALVCVLFIREVPLRTTILREDEIAHGGRPRSSSRPVRRHRAADDRCGTLEHEVGVLIRRVRRVIGERARAVHPDLQPASYLVLTYLADAGRAAASAIVEAFGIDKGAVSRQVQHLVDLGLLERTPDPADGRATLLAVTDDARRRLADVTGTAASASTSGSATGPTRSSAPSSTCSAATTPRSTSTDAPRIVRRPTFAETCRTSGTIRSRSARSQAAVSGGSGGPGQRRRRGSSGPLATSTSPAGSGTGARAAVEHRQDRAAAHDQHVALGVGQVDVVARRRRERTAGRQRRAVERQRRLGVGLLRRDGEVGPVGRLRDPRLAVARAEAVRRLRRPPTGSAPGSRRDRARRCGTRTGPAGAPGRRRPARGRAPRPGRGTPSRAAPASSASPPGRGPGRPSPPPYRVACRTTSWLLSTQVGEPPTRPTASSVSRDDLGERRAPTTARSASGS